MKYLWIGPERTLPKVGLCKTGERVIDEATTRLTFFEIKDLMRQQLIEPMDELKTATDEEAGASDGSN